MNAYEIESFNSIFKKIHIGVICVGTVRIGTILVSKLSSKCTIKTIWDQIGEIAFQAYKKNGILSKQYKEIVEELENAKTVDELQAINEKIRLFTKWFHYV